MVGLCLDYRAGTGRYVNRGHIKYGTLGAVGTNSFALYTNLKTRQINSCNAVGKTE
jgi:hypothetical protein